MAMKDNRQRYMPLPDDRLPGRGKELAYPEAVLVNPMEPEFIGEVLYKENVASYPWNFIFRQSFWRKKNSSELHDFSLQGEINGKLSKEDSSSGPAVEAISLEMKQQELDGRWTC